MLQILGLQDPLLADQHLDEQLHPGVLPDVRGDQRGVRSLDIRPERELLKLPSGQSVEHRLNQINPGLLLIGQNPLLKN